MIDTDSPKHIRELFAKFAHASKAGDVATFRALCPGPDPFQEQMFLRQSLRLRDNELSMVLRRFNEENEMATVYYDLVDRKGNVVESTSLTVVEESLGWFIEEL